MRRTSEAEYPFLLWLASFAQKGLRVLDNGAELLTPASFDPEGGDVPFKRPIASNCVFAFNVDRAQLLDFAATFRLHKGATGMEAATAGGGQR